MCYNNHGDNMKKNVKIKYKSIFKYPEHQETLNFSGVGAVLNKDGTRIIFEDKNISFDILIKKDEVLLKNNNTSITLKKNKVVTNDYHTQYGTCLINCMLKSVSNHGDIKIVYDLLDNGEVVCTVYIIISLIYMEVQYEA